MMKKQIIYTQFRRRPILVLSLFALFFLTACTPSTLEDFRSEAETQSKELSRELSRIHSCNDLEKALPHLRKKFLKFADLLVAVRVYRSNHPDCEAIAEPSYASDELFAELSRIYEFPGGKEIIEKAEIPAIELLTKL